MKFKNQALSSLLTFITFLSLSFFANAADYVKTDQAKLSLIAAKYDKNGDISVGVNFELKKGWKIYWKNAGDVGYPPQFDWSKSSNINENINIKWPVPTRSILNFDGFYSESNEYKNQVIFPIYLQASNLESKVKLNLDLDYAICKDICIPASNKLSLDIAPNYISQKNESLIDEFITKVPEQNGNYGVTISPPKSVRGENLFIIEVKSDTYDLSESDLFIENNHDYIFEKSKQIILDNGKNVIFKFKYKTEDSSLLNKNFTFTLANKEQSVELTVSGNDIEIIENDDLQNIESQNNFNIYSLIFLAFIGGIILNFMPCVLPVISIKIMSIVKLKDSSRLHITKSFLATILGIITSFLTLAIIVSSLKYIGVNVGWGVHFQQPIFILSLMAILTFFVGNVLGFFEFNISFSSNNFLYTKSDEKSFMGNFFSGVLATILATPCTAPFLGTAVGFALANSTIYIFIIFLAIALGLALPYIILILCPSFVKVLPKPGAWMLSLKKIMAALLFLTIIWLSFVIYGQVGWVAAIFSISLSAVILSLLFQGQRKGLFSKSLKIVIILLSLLFFAIPVIFDNASNSKSDFSLMWENFDKENLTKHINDDKIVFIDITADWCLTCKFNKLTTLNSSKIKNLFLDPNIITMRGDWTNQNQEISNYLKEHNRAGIPFNAVYSKKNPSGIILSEILTKKQVINAIELAR